MGHHPHRSSLVGVQPLPVITENPGTASNLSHPSLSPSPASPAAQYRRSLTCSSPSRSPSPYIIQAPRATYASEKSWQPPHFPVGVPATYMPTPTARYSNGHSIATHYAPRHQRYHSSSSINEKNIVPLVMPVHEKDSDWFARRGGWWRVSLYGFLFVIVIVGLGVGLSIGLNKTKNTESESSTSTDMVSAREIHLNVPHHDRDEMHLDADISNFWRHKVKREKLWES